MKNMKKMNSNGCKIFLNQLGPSWVKNCNFSSLVYFLFQKDICYNLLTLQKGKKRTKREKKWGIHFRIANHGWEFWDFEGQYCPDLCFQGMFECIWNHVPNNCPQWPMHHQRFTIAQLLMYVMDFCPRWISTPLHYIGQAS